ncbi:putative membrane protein, partial [Vibrio parahaemolyticus IDH02640]
PSVAAILIVPSSSISIVVPVSSVRARITAPPLPITSLIFSALIFIVWIRGANSEISSRAPASASSITDRMCLRAPCAWLSAICMISLVIPSILMSI